jgi:hypothetical protein
MTRIYERHGNRWVLRAAFRSEHVAEHHMDSIRADGAAGRIALRDADNIPYYTMRRVGAPHPSKIWPSRPRHTAATL